MKICLVHEEYPEETNFGGIATYQKICAEEYVKNGHTVYVICKGLRKSRQYIENGVNIFRIYVNKKENQINYYIAYRKKVCELLQKLQEEQKIDIVEVPDWGAETIFFEEFRKIPLVVRLHTPLKIWLKYNKNIFGEITSLMLDWEEKMIKSANLITCCSSALRALVVKDFKVQKKQIIITPNPANITNFYYDKKIKKENILLFVGSLEERKGVCVLARALNMVFKKFPCYKIKFIGKDTERNNLNMSTIQYIKKIVDHKYLKNLEFLGQLKNSELNPHLNSAKCAIYPSLFDNFPYVVLETMATGTPIVGSSNSGMVEMLGDNSSLYKAGDYKDLAKKIINKLHKATIEIENIRKVKQLYSPDNICGAMVEIYRTTINKYHDKSIDKETLKEVLRLALLKDSAITSFKKENEGVANKVVRVETLDNSYIVKKYLYKYDFNLSNALYKIYENNNIKAVRPINEQPIVIANNVYNVFRYLKKQKLKTLCNDYFLNLILAERKVSKNDNKILQKCENFSNKIINLQRNKNFLKKDSKFVQDIFECIKKEKILNEAYLNHGDISFSNIIKYNNNLFLIDFDETLISSRLYDFAVIVIKIFSRHGRLNKKNFKQFFDLLKANLTYTNKEYLNVIKFYLCKILLEKFYLHYTNKINLKSRTQKKDYYKRYIKLLKYFMNSNIFSEDK